MSSPPLSPSRRAGDLVFTSGQLGRDGEGRIVEGGIEAQARQAIANLVSVLTAAGCTPADVVKVTAWLTDPDFAAAFNDIYRETFGAPYPARSTVISGLLAPGALIEIEAIAYRPAGHP